MASIAGLLVPNNFDIYANSIITTGPPTTQIPASELYSGSGLLNVIDIGNAPNPVGGQVLTAADPNSAIWTTPEVTLSNTVSLTNKNLTDESNNSIASGLWCALGTVPISIRSGPQPVANDVLLAVNGTTAEWQKLPTINFPTTTVTSFETSVNVNAGTTGPIVSVNASTLGKYYLTGEIMSFNSDNNLNPTTYNINVQFTVRGGPPLVQNVSWALTSPSYAGSNNWATPPQATGNGTNTVQVISGDTGNNITFIGWWNLKYQPY